jgi:predicted esterase
LDDTVRATVRDSLSLFRSMQAGDIQETNYPVAARLKLCEAILASNDINQEILSSTATLNDSWLSLAVGRKSVPVRMALPKQQDSPRPVLFLFHGAGGSENMFFETYGAGRMVSEGIRRDWIVIAPRQGLLGLSLDISDMLDVVAEFYPVDRTRVFLVGHSMGAAQVVRQCGLKPDLPRAAVALGGGGRTKDPTKVAAIRFLVGTGDQDFGRNGAIQLHRGLVSAGVDSRYIEYPDVEHMVIVQAAIDDVFSFLDESLRDP